MYYNIIVILSRMNIVFEYACLSFFVLERSSLLLVELLW